MTGPTLFEVHALSEPPADKFLYIGLCDIDFLPTNVEIVKQTNFQAFPRLRDRGTDKINQGNVRDVLRIEFVVFSVNELRTLVDQFRNTPFVPISNAFVNGNLGITDVALLNLQVNAVPKIPGLYMCVLQLLPFDLSTIAWREMLATQIDHNMYNWYIKEFIPANKTKHIFTDGKVETVSIEDSDFDPIDNIDFHFEMLSKDFLETLEDLLELRREALGTFYLSNPDLFITRGNDVGMLRDFDDGGGVIEPYGKLYGYLTKVTPVSAQTIVELHRALSDGKPLDKESEIYALYGQWSSDMIKLEDAPDILINALTTYKSFFIGINVEQLRPMSDSIDVYLDTLFNPADYTRAQWDKFTLPIRRFFAGDIASYNDFVGHLEGFKDKNSVQNFSRALLTDMFFGGTAVNQQLGGVLGWMVALLSDAQYFDAINIDSKNFHFSHLIDPSWYRKNYIPIGLSDMELIGHGASLENNFAAIHTQSQKTTNPVYQYLGGGDVVLNLKFRTTNPDDVSLLLHIYETTQSMVKNFDHSLMMGFIGFRCRDISRLFETREYIVTAAKINTIEENPHLYEIDLQLIEYDIEQKLRAIPDMLSTPHREQVSNTPLPAGIKDLIDMDGSDPNHVRAIYDTWWMVRDDTTRMNTYADITLPTRAQLRTAMSKIGAQQQVPYYDAISDVQYHEDEYLDPDFYIKYEELPEEQPVKIVVKDAVSSDTTDTKQLTEEAQQGGQVTIEIGGGQGTKTVKGADVVFPTGDPHDYFIDHNRYDVSNRLVQLFPTFHFIITEEFAVHFGYRVSDNLYGANRILRILIDKNGATGMDTADIVMSNMHGFYQNPMADLATLHVSDLSMIGSFMQDWWSELVSVFSNASLGIIFGAAKEPENVVRILKEFSDSNDLIHNISNSLFLKPGHRLRISMGYGANPERLPVVFMGKITEINGGGDKLHMVCQSDAVELTNVIHPSIKTESDIWHWSSIDTTDVWDKIFNTRGDPGLVGQTIGKWYPRQKYYNACGIQHFGLSSPFLKMPDAVEIGTVESDLELLGAAPEPTDPNAPIEIEIFDLVGGDETPMHMDLSQPTQVDLWEGFEVPVFHRLRISTFGEIFLNIYPPLDLTTAEGKIALDRETLPETVSQGRETNVDGEGELNIEQTSIFGKSVWEVLKIYALSTPDYVLSCVPFENRASLFYGMSRFPYVWEYYNPGKVQVARKTFGDAKKYVSPGISGRSKPFMQACLLADHNIVANTVIASSENITNVCIPLNSDGNEAKDTKVQVDSSIMPSEQKISTVETGIRYSLWENTLANYIPACQWNYLDSVLVSIGTMRDAMRQMYQGQVMVLGNTFTKPFDIGVLNDPDTGMTGMFEVGRVNISFTSETGMATAIKPNLMMSFVDPAYWPLVQIIFSIGTQKIAKIEELTTLAANAQKLFTNHIKNITPPIAALSIDLAVTAAFKGTFAKSLGLTGELFVAKNVFERSAIIGTGRAAGGAIATSGKLVKALWGLRSQGLAAFKTAQITKSLVSSGVSLVKINPVGVVMAFIGLSIQGFITGLTRQVSFQKCLSMSPLLLNCAEFSAGITGHQGTVIGEVITSNSKGLENILSGPLSYIFFTSTDTIHKFDTIGSSSTVVRAACASKGHTAATYNPGNVLPLLGISESKSWLTNVKDIIHKYAQYPVDSVPIVPGPSNNTFIEITWKYMGRPARQPSMSPELIKLLESYGKIYGLTLIDHIGTIGDEAHKGTTSYHNHVPPDAIDILQINGENMSNPLSRALVAERFRQLGGVMYHSKQMWHKHLHVQIPGYYDGAYRESYIGS